jgi:hypothetical protein
MGGRRIATRVKSAGLRFLLAAPPNSYQSSEVIKQFWFCSLAICHWLFVICHPEDRTRLVSSL